MAQREFDIYQTAQGVTAVTNPVQRQILAALSDGDRQLPDLVELTGKAKPTLSGIHMKELLNRELIQELPHPTDSRRKVFRLAAKPLGTSGVPVEQLRSAVKQYARQTAAVPGVPLSDAFKVLAAAPPRTSKDALRAQARALGGAAAARLDGTSARDFAMSFSRFVEEEGLAEHMQIDFEKLTFRCRPGQRVAGSIPAERMGLLLAGFAEGAAAHLGLSGVSFAAEGDAESFFLRPA